jgi:hypothetical protein
MLALDRGATMAENPLSDETAPASCDRHRDNGLPF